MPTRDRIRDRREQLNLTQRELADRLNRWFPTWDWSIISKIERGVRTLKADELPYIAIALECSVLDLLDSPVD